MRLNNSLNFKFTLITILGYILGIIILQKHGLKQLETVHNREIFLKQQEQFSALAKIQKQLPSFGFNNLLADWTFLKFIQYFGDLKARQVTGYSTVTDYFEDIVNRDPNFIQSHLVMSAANSLFAVQPEKTVDLINRVLKTVNPQVPNYPFLLWTYKATDEILFLGDIEAAQNSYKMAATWAKRREDDLGEEMAERFNKTANFLASGPNPIQAQFGAWMNTLSSTKDRRTQNYVLNQLKELGAEINISPDGKLEIKPPKFNKA